MSSESAAASPISTGGGGTHFEQHVDAMFLAILLVKGFPPVLPGCLLRQVCFQTRHLGWHTDDILLVATEGETNRKLAAQVKLSLTIGEKDEECQKTFRAMWVDYNNVALFDPQVDRLGLFVQRGTNTLLGDFGRLLDIAHTAAGPSDFATRLATSSKKTKEQAKAIRSIIGVSAPPSEADFLGFLKTISLGSYDLATKTATTEHLLRSLLASTANTDNPIETGDATWSALLEVISLKKSQAACFTRKDLPAVLLDRHGHVSSKDEAALKNLLAHSAITVGRISDTIGGKVTVQRAELVGKALAVLEGTRAVLITGVAGSGKSGLAKEVLAQMPDAVPLAFRAEELAKSHLDQTLLEAHADLSVSRLASLLAAQTHKLILVESLERLLEADVREGFSDLLALVQSDPAIRLVMTCRDYSVDTVRSSLLAPSGLRVQEIKVNGFADAELEQVASALPSLVPLLREKGLRELLRLPYMLEMAARMSWSVDTPIPAEEFAFRSRCWRDIISKEGSSADAMPKRRSDTFVNLSLRRAKELRPFVPIDGLDPRALDALRKDGLVALADDTTALAAPSHDVLEDWALMRWLDDTYAVLEYDPQALAGVLTPHPAIRRSVRKWLGELLKRQPDRADRFVVNAVTSSNVPAYLRDDALTATLLSESHAAFLERNSADLLANDAATLIRAIHLLRVAAKTPSPWLPRAISDGFLVADGPAWPAMVTFVNRHLKAILPRQIPLLIGLIEDWAMRVSVMDPEPDAFKDAGSIAFQILDLMGDSYGGDGLKKRILSVIARIPTAWPERLDDLINRACDDKPDATAREFLSIVLPGLEGTPTAKAFPEEMIRLAKNKLLMQPGYKPRGYESPGDIERFFGMRRDYEYSFFPASSLRGPFATLLRHHPKAGVKLVLDLCNHAGTWYAEDRSRDRLELAFPIIFVLPEGAEVKQWGNGRLWGLYRGITVGPDALKSSLMALEQWLLDLCQHDDIDVDSWLLWLLTESNNVAVTGVLASVCMAHPSKAPRTAVTLLTSREAIWMDRQRMVGEGFGSSISEAFGSISDHVLYESERKTANLLQHRKADFEMMAIRLQQTSAREDVWRVIDKHRASLPAEDNQTENDRIWRLALHRMDLRGFREVDPPPNAPAQATDGQQVAYYGPALIEPDVQEMMDKARVGHQALERDLALLNWAMAVWEGKADSAECAHAWREMLIAARQRVSASDPVADYAKGGAELIAAICVRDHFEELDSSERTFCLGMLVSEIDRNADTDDRQDFYGGVARSDRASALAICRAVAGCDPRAPDMGVMRCFAKALVHAIPEVRAYAAAGARRYFGGPWRGYMVRCAASLAVEASELEAAKGDDDWYDRRSEVSAQVRARVREAVATGGSDASALRALDFGTWSGRSAGQLILTILSTSPDLEAAREVYAILASYFARVWKWKRHDEREDRHYEFEYQAASDLAAFVLRLPSQEAVTICSPLLPLVEDDSEDLGRFIRDLIIAEDAAESPTPFWELWRLFSEPLKTSWRIKGASKDERYDSAVLRAAFLGARWKHEVTSWSRMAGHEKDVETLAKELTPSPAVLRAFCNFLSTVGGTTLPKAFVTVADILSKGEAGKMLRSRDSALLLESLLRRFTYREPFRVKSDPPVRQAILRILDDLVDNGSSAAFRMRDDFVTPGRSADLRHS
jgi:hypothetical protein